MILPHPESDMRLNIMVLGSEIVSMLKSKKNSDNFHFIENVLSDFLKVDKKRTVDLFIFSLIFLYSVGIIEHQGYKIKLNSQIESTKQLNLF